MHDNQLVTVLFHLAPVLCEFGSQQGAALVLQDANSPRATGSLVFDPPSIAGTTGFPSDFQGLGDGQHVLGKNGDDGWRGSADGGSTWSEVLEGQQQSIRGDAPGYHAVVTARPGALHNMGNVTAVGDRDAGTLPLAPGLSRSTRCVMGHSPRGRWRGRSRSAAYQTP